MNVAIACCTLLVGDVVCLYTSLIRKFALSTSIYTSSYTLVTYIMVPFRYTRHSLSSYLLLPDIFSDSLTLA